MIARTLTQTPGSVKLYVRELREAGLLTTGARGVNAPHMTTLDAARLVIALLATDKPSECVERVKRFGQLKYSPNFRKRYQGYQTIQPEEFATLFQGENLEEVLASIFGLPERIGAEAACAWYCDNAFHLRVNDFNVLAELYSWITGEDSNTIIGERVVPFKGKIWADRVEGEFPRAVEGWTPISGGIETTREIAAVQFSAIGLEFWSDALTQSSEVAAKI